ncbi:hypothetical protein Hanom_Chr08g00742461 [Helianthus anomalus]
MDRQCMNTMFESARRIQRMKDMNAILESARRIQRMKDMNAILESARRIQRMKDIVTPRVSEYQSQSQRLTFVYFILFCIMWSKCCLIKDRMFNQCESIYNPANQIKDRTRTRIIWVK